MYKNFTWKGVQIPYTASQIRTSRWRANFDINGLVADNKQFERAGTFGVTTIPTTPRARIINIQGEIIATNEADKCTALQEIELLFNPVCNGCSDDEFFTLEFEDWCGRSWYLNAKVYQFIKMPIGLNCEPVIRFNAQLLAEEPYIFSQTVESEVLPFSLFGGITLEDTLATPLCELSDYVDVDNDGTFCAPTIFEITGPITNPRAYVGCKFFGLNLDLGVGQTLIINSQDQTATVNGANVLGARMPNSTWLNLDVGMNQVGYTGDDYDWDNPHPSSAIIKYNDTRI